MAGLPPSRHSTWMNDRRLNGSEIPLSRSRIGSRNASRNNSDEEDYDGSDNEDGSGAANGKKQSGKRKQSGWDRRTSDVRSQRSGPGPESSRKGGAAREDGNSFSRVALPRPRPMYPDNSKE